MLFSLFMLESEITVTKWWFGNFCLRPCIIISGYYESLCSVHTTAELYVKMSCSGLSWLLTANFSMHIRYFLYPCCWCVQILVMKFSCRTSRKWILKKKFQLKTLRVTPTCVHLTAHLSFQPAMIMYQLVTACAKVQTLVNHCPMCAIRSLYLCITWMHKCLHTLVNNQVNVASAKTRLNGPAIWRHIQHAFILIISFIVLCAVTHFGLRTS